MALDERIQTGVAESIALLAIRVNRRKKMKAHGIYYYVPGILKEFDRSCHQPDRSPPGPCFMTGRPGSRLPRYRHHKNRKRGETGI